MLSTILQHYWVQVFLTSIGLVLFYMTVAVIGSRRGWFVLMFKLFMALRARWKKSKSTD